MSLDSDLRGVHPTLDLRIRGLLSEPSLRRYGTYPAVRSRAKQEALYAKYKAGRGNLAANPHRTLRTGSSFPYAWTPKGSWHMVQGDGYGHAVDLRRPVGVTRSMADRAVKPLLKKWGLKQTVRTEWWHLQALTSQGWLDGPTPSDTEGLTEMQIINDTEKKRMFASWTLNGTTVVREYSSYRGPDVGESLPGISIIIDEQVGKNQIIKA